MDHPSLKKEVITALSFAPKLESLRDNDVVFLTAFGVLTGRVPPEDTTNLLLSLSDEITKRYKTKAGIGEGERIPGNDGFIVLENVSIRTSSGATFNLKELILFYDQIIGMMLGRIQTD